MRARYIIPPFVAVLLLTNCVANYRSSYNYPEHFAGADKEKFYDVLEKGRKIYNMNCSKCHGAYSKKTDSLPHFSNQQVDNYTARFLYRDPKNHAFVARMDPEQLNDVFLFLRFRKIK